MLKGTSSRVCRNLRPITTIAASILFLCCFFTPEARSQVLPLTSYTPQDTELPLPSAEVRSTFQDPLGYIWMAIYSSGLIRYNGHSFDYYDADDGLEYPGVREILSDHQGRLWITSDAGLSASLHPLPHYADGSPVTFTSTLGAVDLLDVSIRQNAITVDQEGGVWVGTTGEGIVRYAYASNNTLTEQRISTSVNGNPSISVFALVAREDGSVWAATNSGEVLVFKDASSNFERMQLTEAATINSLYEDAAGTLWAGTNNGALLRLNESDGGAEWIVFDVLEGDILSITAKSGHELWVASQGQGLFSIDVSNTSSPKRYTEKNGLLSENLHHVMVDREQNLWISQSGGASKLRFDYEAYTHITAVSYAGEQPLLPSSLVNTIQLDSLDSTPCYLAIGTQTGGIACLQPGMKSFYIQEEDGLRSNRVYALEIDKEGRLWAGTASGMNGIVFNGSASLPLAAQSQTVRIGGQTVEIASYKGTSIYSMKKHALKLNGEDTSGSVESIWFPGFRSIYLLVEDKWYIFRANSGLPATYYNVVEFDDEGYLWVGTDDEGLYRSVGPVTLEEIQSKEYANSPYSLEGRTGTFGREILSSFFEPVWTIGNGAPSNQIQSLLWHDGLMWAGTSNGIVALDEGNQSALLSTSDGLLSSNVNSMAASIKSGSVWAGTNRGLAEIDPYAKEVVRVLTRQSGLIDNESWFYGSVSTDSKGQVYYGTANGITIFNPALDTPNRVQPEAAIHESSFAEDPYGNNAFDVAYAGLSFANEKQVQFRTRLLGYDADWSPVTREFKTRYTNLPAFLWNKSYTFQVQASNNDDLWSTTPVAYSFVVQPPVWFRWWAILAYMLGILGVFMLTVRVQRARLLKQERARAELDKARELASINKELQDALTHLTETRDQLIHAEKMSSLGQLTAGIAHEIKNPLNFIKNFSELNTEYLLEVKSFLDQSRDPATEASPSSGKPEPHTDYNEASDAINSLLRNSEAISKYGKRANDIVESMMLHARERSNQKSALPLNLIVREYLDLSYHSVQSQWGTFSATLDVQLDQTIDTILAIQQDIGHVLLNIYKNAFQALNDRLVLEPDFQPRIQVHSKLKGEEVEIQIMDNGVGIPTEKLDRIFEPFFTTRPSGSGTGLGLSISYDIIVQGHGGTLTVESEEGKGTMFIITVPV